MEYFLLFSGNSRVTAPLRKAALIKCFKVIHKPFPMEYE
ncbi:hypothetical protein LEP1GSC047_1336 [Leptospira inadai serovar Lyme str. 10]|uniref:Uncharacterized protein n=1 Tax=Leptospira inadai serovar Lyme str. 10 TaxID=1049790 RepID=V6H901_9LEPT|nr:hypothetical protein LEP1GSC047_1336 [Leptospira inadai serovar Lyme str. 10]